MTLLGALVVVLVLLSSPATANTPPSIAPNASPGTLDLSSWPLHTKALALETVWDVWWNVLDTQPAGPAHAQVAIPSKWEGDAPQPTSARPGTGHATYQLKVTGLPHDLTELGMYVRTLGLSYRLTARDSTGHERLILSSGHPGTSPETTVPWEVPQIGSFKKLVGPTLLFTIEISNYHYAHGGPWRAPVLGPERALRQTLLQEQFTDFALVGLLAIVALYHFALFLVRRKDKASLWFALFLSCLLVRHACTGRLFELFLFDASAEVYEFRNRIEFLSMYLLLPLVWQFLHTVFPEAFGKRSRNIIAGIFAVFSSTCLLHVSSYSQVLPAFHAIVLPAGIIAMVFLGRAILAGHPQSKLTFGAFSAVLGTSVHDILVVFFNLDHPWLLAYGIAAFVLLQSYVIAQLFAEAYQRATNLTSALSQEITSRRAVEGELHDVQTKLDGAKQELKDSEKLLVQAQKLASIGELVASIGHELKNPLQTLSLQTGIRKDATSYLDKFLSQLFDEDDEDAREAKRIIDAKFEQLETSRLRDELAIERMKEISMALNRSGRMDSDPVACKLSDVIEDAHILVSGKLKTRKFTQNLSAQQLVWCHPSHLGQVLTNLLSNAADALDEIHGKGQGCLHIQTMDHLRAGERGLLIQVEDDGAGVPEDIRQKIMQPFFTTKAAGVGTGLGLAICAKIIAAHHGSLEIDTSPELGGARFSIWLPLDFRQKQGSSDSETRPDTVRDEALNRLGMDSSPFRSPADK